MRIYDNAARAVVNAGARSLCRWLDEPTDDASLIAAEYESGSIDPGVVLLLSPFVALHLEIQAFGSTHIPGRFLEHNGRLRRWRALKRFSIRNQVLVLGKGFTSDHIHDESLRFDFRVRYLRKEDPLPLLADPVLAPFAALADVPGNERQEVLLQAARSLGTGGRTTLLQATRDLAQIRLKRDEINEVWSELALPIPLDRYSEGLPEGLKAGHFDGVQTGVFRTIAWALAERFGDDRRISLITHGLAKEPEGWFKRVMEAGSLDDLWSD
jgi:hypothetical protein